MERLVLSMVIEGNKEDLHEIKGKIIATASEAMISCTTNVIEEQKKQIEIPKFMVGVEVARRG